jgi:hypothetical protein
MKIVAQTKKRSKWPAYRTLAALGLPRSVYYAWTRRESLDDRVGKTCRVYEVLPEERAAICEFALQYPKIGYRKLTWASQATDANRPFKTPIRQIAETA